MPEGEPTNGYCSSSSGEEDGDAAWRAAIDSIAQTTTYVSSTTKHTHPNHDDDDDYDGHKPKTRQLKHYQLKAQNLLNEILENSIEIVRKPVPVVDEDPESNECGIRLFKHAQPGIVFDHMNLNHQGNGLEYFLEGILMRNQRSLESRLDLLLLMV
uniref:Uncharacterized protein n=1 Tax=Glycine max TaxID=3847 RepID=A0A0R0JTH6_SOYBN